MTADSKKALQTARERNCEVCGWGEVDRHHCRTRGAGGSDEPHNLVHLCRDHHTEIHRIGVLSFLRKYPQFARVLKEKGWEWDTGKLWHPKETR